MVPAVCRDTNDASFLKWLNTNTKASFLQLLCEIPNQKKFSLDLVIQNCLFFLWFLFTDTGSRSD